MSSNTICYEELRDSMVSSVTELGSDLYYLDRANLGEAVYCLFDQTRYATVASKFVQLVIQDDAIELMRLIEGHSKSFMTERAIELAAEEEWNVNSY